MDLAAADFTAFFRAIHGDLPFPWQQRLVDLLAARDEWPDVLDLPTGSGKTAALDAAVFHLALRFECAARAALRIALVVDRRLVVDDAHGRARSIEKALVDPTCVAEAERGVVVEVARRLQRLAGDGEPPLVARRLRGGAPLESDWARTPTQPTILCSTVDQVGSRLLFRGYGVSDRMKPVHAGLFGRHSLILLDEAHLAEPFRQTLRAVQGIGGADVRSVLLSATPGVKAERPFGLQPGDYADPKLKRRLEAPKPAKLSVVRGNPGDAFVRAARAAVERLQGEGVSAPAVGVVVNRVGLAREIFEKLRTQEDEIGSDTVLLIGRSRAAGRDRIVEEKLGPYRTGRSRPSSMPTQVGAGQADGQRPLRHEGPGGLHVGPLLVVATQCLEVGVDLDLDGLVTQAASFDALRQRFGRLNRAGRAVSAIGAILAVAEDIAQNADDPVYGDRIAETWKTLQQLVGDREVDFGIKTLDRNLREVDADVTALAAPGTRVPTLMPAYVDLWSQTSPPPSADPDVGLFLHGVERASVGVSFVWRSDITTDDLAAGRDLTPLLQLVPPRAAEMVEVPLWSARAWLGRSRNRERLTSISDVGERGTDEAADEIGRSGRSAFRWAGADDARTACVSPDALRPGDVLVVPADYGGCDEFGWAPPADTQVADVASDNQIKRVTDVADEAARPFRSRRHAVRVARDVVSLGSEWDRLREVIADEGLSGHEMADRLLSALPAESPPESIAENEDDSRLRVVREPLEALLRASERSRIVAEFPYADGRNGGVVLVAPRGLREPGSIDRARPGGGPATEDDRLSRTAGKPVSIDTHTEHVVANVNRSVRALGDAVGPVANDLRLAAYLHDAGKADPRFQTLLSGGDPWNRPDGPAMAKSGRQSPKDARERAGLPRGWRHEVLSVRMAQAHPRFAEAGDPALVLWLIGTHHGFGRPFFDFADPHERGSGHDGVFACLGVERWKLAPRPGPQSMAFDFDGADWAAIYEQLKQRYGVWGLAHLEAVLRLADHRASESEQDDD